MPPRFELVVCVTSSALFDCSESPEVWKQGGPEAYKEHQRSFVTVPLKPGVGFPLVRSLLALNEAAGTELVEVVLVSRKDGVSGERVRQSINHYNLRITRMSFTDGTDVTRYLPAWGCDLFLSADEDQVRRVLSDTVSEDFAGIAAGFVYSIAADATFIQLGSSSTGDHGTRKCSHEATMTALSCACASPVPSYWPVGQVRIVFDGDGVLFSDQAERVFKTKGLKAFLEFERENGQIALPKGPMQAFALKLQRVRAALGEDNKWRVRIFLVTARSDVANVRVFNTLKEWGLDIDETHFLGGLDKTPFVRFINPAIFFDDSSEHIDRAKQHVPVARVVYGINNPEIGSPIIVLDTETATAM
jgi:5'-nucleotidase